MSIFQTFNMHKLDETPVLKELLERTDNFKDICLEDLSIFAHKFGLYIELNQKAKELFRPFFSKLLQHYKNIENIEFSIRIRIIYGFLLYNYSE